MKVLPVNFGYFINKPLNKELPRSEDNNTQNEESLNSTYYHPLKIFSHYSQALPFKGITAKGLVKQRGMFMHITSLPGTRSFCGQFGDIQTTKFINWLAAAKQTHWIMNPLNALEDNLCPYSSAGRFSRNKFIVNHILRSKSFLLVNSQ